MARFLTKGLVFVLATAALYLLEMTLLCRVKLGDHPLVLRTGDFYHARGGIAYAKFKEFDPAARFDVLVIGSSHAYRGYDPRIFARHGLRMFNLGSSAQTPMNSFHVLKNHVAQGSRPLVIYDVYEGAFENDGLESTSELVVNIGSDKAALGMAWELCDLREINMLAVRYLLADGPPAQVDSTYRAGGFAERADSLQEPVTYPRYDLTRMRKDQVEHLARTLAWCRQQELPVVLVSHYYPHQADSLGHAAFAALIDSVRAPYSVPYIDLAFGHTLSDRDHFYDHNHLNQAGVERFNAQLIPMLREQGLLRREGEK
jgi:hypothetical protein